MTGTSASIFRATIQWLLCFVFCNTQAQAIKYQSYTSEQGLSENVIYCQLIDSRGFLWIGTDFGLNRYDGYRFRQFLKKNDDTNSLSHNGIEAIAEDAKQRIWVSTFRDLDRIDGLSGKVTRLYLNNTGTGSQIRDIIMADSSHLLIVRTHEILLFDTEKLTYSILFSDGRYEIIPKIFRTGKGDLILTGTCHGEPVILTYDPLNKKIIPYSQREFLPFIRNRVVRYFSQDGLGYTYIKYQGAGPICIYDDKGAEVYTSRSDPNFNDSVNCQIYNTLDAGNHEFWIATTMGLKSFNRKTNRLEAIRLEGEDNLTRTIPDIRTLSRNRQGVIWMGTFGEGILKVARTASPFRNLIVPGYEPDRSNNMIFGLYPVPGATDVFAAERGFSGLSLIRKNLVVNTFSKRALTLEKSVLMTTGKNIHGLSEFLQGKLREMYRDRKLIPYHFTIPDDSTLLYEWHYNVFIVHPGGEYVIDVGGYSNISLYNDEVWIASNKGLYKISLPDHSITHYKQETDNTCSLSENYLYTAIPDSVGNLWIGTKGGGLNYFDRKAGCFVKYTMEHGLPDNVIYSIQADGKGYLWLTTNRGLSRFNPGAGEFTNFSRRDGLINMEYNRQGAIKLGDSLYFSGTVGIDYFNPSDISENNQLPEVYLSDIHSGNQEITHDVNSSKKNIFPYNRNNITIRFTTNDFVRPDLVYFRYRITDQEKWTRMIGENTVSFAYLAPGNYNFSVQASYNNQIWGEIRQFNFVIKEPWWNTIWFYLSALFVLILLFTLIYRYRLWQIKKLFSIRNRISRDLHDEVGATLSSIHVYSAVANNVLSTDQTQAKEALEQIGRNSRKVMQSMNDIIWAINPAETNGSSFEGKLKDYGYELLAPANILCSYSIEAEAEKKLVNMEARRNLLLIAREAMHNASKHSACSRVDITFHTRNRFLILEIRDNGSGISTSSTHAGNGLRNMKLRCEHLEGRFQLETQKGSGTIIRCTLPLTRISDRR